MENGMTASVLFWHGVVRGDECSTNVNIIPILISVIVLISSGAELQVWLTTKVTIYSALFHWMVLAVAYSIGRAFFYHFQDRKLQKNTSKH